MIRLDRSDIPNGYFYYRSHSDTYFSWIRNNAEKSGSSQILENRFYGLVKHFLGGAFSTAHFEKSDFVPTAWTLAKYGFKRGLVFWSGWRKEKPDSGKWLRLPFVFSHMYHHSARSAFSVLTPEYWKKWGTGPRGHRNAIRKKIESGEISVDTDATLENFLAAYQKTALPHGWKRYLTNRQKYLSGLGDGNVRIFLASIRGEVLAGAVFLDDFPTSTYLIAFQDAKARKSHLGLALVDAWFQDSLSKGFEFLDFDHMKDPLDSASYAGYTEFKSGIADYDMSFDSVWLKWFW